jgi:hypothetical protein
MFYEGRSLDLTVEFKHQRVMTDEWPSAGSNHVRGKARRHSIPDSLSGVRPALSQTW